MTIPILFIEFLEVTAANHLLSMLKGLLAANTGVTPYILGTAGSNLVKEAEKLGIQTYTISAHQQLKLKDPRTYLFFLKTFFLIFQIARKHQIRIIHVHRLNWAYLAAIPAFLCKIPLLIQVVIIEEVTTRYQRILLQYCPNTYFLAVSQSAQQQFIKLYPFAEGKMFVHYGGVYLPDISQSRKKMIHTLEKIKKNHPLLIGMISRIDPLKGVDVFIEAAGILIKKFPDLGFIHVGTNKKHFTYENYEEACKKRVQNLQLASNFYWLPYSNQILSYYPYFYCTVLPSSKDTLGYVVIESALMEVPAIPTQVDGLAETVDTKQAVTISSPASPVQLADKIEYLLTNKKDYKRNQQQYYEFASQRFDATKNAPKLLEIYNSILKKYSSNF